MSDAVEQPKTASDALMKAFEQAENMEEVLIIWTTKDKQQKLNFEDNDLSVAEANLLASSFLWHLMHTVFFG